MKLLLTLSIALSLLLQLEAQDGGDTQSLDDIDQLVTQALTRENIPGVVVGVSRGGKTIFARGYGYADLELEVPMQVDSVFRIGSVTKQFTAAAIMRLVEAGELDLDAEVNDLIPDYAFEGRVVTVEQLLRHTSGIKSYTSLGREWQSQVRQDLSHKQLIDMVRDKPFDFAPGQGWAYNNSGYYLLGVIIEEAAGRPYGEYIEEEFFGPLKMTRSDYGWEQPIIKGRAEGYSVKDGQIVNDDFLSMGQPYAAGSLLSTAGDLLSWTRALHDGQVLDEESFERMITPLETNRPGNGYGYGLMISEFNGHRRIAHGGGIFGFSTQLSYYPDDDLCIAVLLNTDAASASRLEGLIARRMLNIVVPTSTSGK